MYWEHWVPGGIILLHFIQLSFSLCKHMLVSNWDDTLQKKMTLILKIIKKKYSNSFTINWFWVIAKKEIILLCPFMYNAVLYVTFQVTKGRLYSGCHDGSLIIWDATKLREDEDDIYQNFQENGVKK